MKVVWFGKLSGLPEMILVCEGYSDLSTSLMNVSFGKGCMGASLKMTGGGHGRATQGMS